VAQTSFTHADLMTLWELNGGSPALADTAAAVAQAESGGCLYAKHGPVDDRPEKICTYTYSTGEDSYGLWQINRQAHPQYSPADLYTANGNAAAAVAIATGAVPFYPWTQYRNGAYLPFLVGTVGTQPGQGVGASAPSSALAPQGHRGYADLRNSLGRHLPTQLERSKHTGQRTLSLLTHPTRKRR